MAKLAFVFPGQGSQSVGMGKDLYDNCEEAKNIFDKADQIIGKSISKICFEGPDEDLKQTINTQPAILTTSIAALEALKSAIKVEPAFVAGHSLGEYGALYQAGVLSLDATLQLIQKRAEAMSEAKGGAMAAVLGLDDDKVKEITKSVNETYATVADPDDMGDATTDLIKLYVDVANYNCPGQVVITGSESGIAKASELLKEAGAKRVLPLAVSGAFHSKLMKGASEKFAQFAQGVELNDASIPVVTNVDAEITKSAEDFKKKMPEQIYSSVYWTQSVQKMVEEGVDTFVEIGPGKVLAGLIKKIAPEAKVYNVFDKASLDVCVEALNLQLV